MKNLGTLVLFDNLLKTIPDNIGELKNLKELILDDNLLENIPESLTQCKKLIHLDLSRNKLSEANKEKIKQPFSYIQKLIL